MLTPDSIVPDPANPQSFNRYSYVENRPINFSDPTGHCKNGRGTGPGTCQVDGGPDVSIGTWRWYDEVAPKNGVQMHEMTNDEFSVFVDQYIEGYLERYDQDAIDLPDAYILGASADTGGWFPSYTVGAEDLYFVETGEVAAFQFDGPGQGAGGSADAGAYFGAVWNLDCVDCYSGDFSIVSVDLGFIVGAEVSVFWAPEGETWGFAVGKSNGISASITRYDTWYRRIDTPYIDNQEE